MDQRMMQQPAPFYMQGHHLAVPVPQVGPKSTRLICKSCNKDIYSKTSKKAMTSAWWSCILLCICGCFCGCCLIPCCMNSCNVVNHNCPSCDAYLGQYRP